MKGEPVTNPDVIVDLAKELGSLRVSKGARQLDTIEPGWHKLLQNKQVRIDGHKEHHPVILMFGVRFVDDFYKQWKMTAAEAIKLGLAPDPKIKSELGKAYHESVDSAWHAEVLWRISRESKKAKAKQVLARAG